jgi:phosphoglycolate phosphatase
VKPRAAIFDLDGTLLDTLEDIADAMNGVLAALGAPVRPVRDYRRFVGGGIEELWRRVLSEDRRDGPAVSAAATAMRQRYGRAWDRATRPYPGVEALLRRLRSASVPLAVLSNKDHAFTERMIERFFEAGTFACVRGAGDLPLKPDPAGALAVAVALHVPPAECLFIGDSVTDMKTAANSGMAAVGVTWGFGDREELVEAGAAEIVDAAPRIGRLFGV